MATVLRTWSYQYPWLYNAVSRLAALSVGGEARLRNLALQGLEIDPDAEILDLCCGCGQVTRFLVLRSQSVVGLDASPRSLEEARKRVPQATYVEGLAEAMPLESDRFDLVHTSMALHEMAPDQRQQILAEVFRVLKPGGIFSLIDFHSPENPLFWPGLAVFLTLFETETAWQLLQLDLPAQLEQTGFQLRAGRLHAGGSLQVIQAEKP